jgi:glycosyltransferase involved in cell wall biosynthesis
MKVRQAVREKYNWKREAKKLIALYNRLLSENGRCRAEK